jgi:hypothetical protein
MLKLKFDKWKEDAKIGAGQLTSDNLIDEDFEAELGGANSFLQSNLTDTTEQETDKATAELKEHIARYDIVNVCGSDLTGRHIIVLSACNLPDNETLQKDTMFKSHQHFFDTLLEYVVRFPIKIVILVIDLVLYS